LVRNLSPNHGHLTRNLSLYYVRRFRTHAIHERKGRINGKRHRAIVTESEDSGSDCLSNLSNQDFQKQDVLFGAAYAICAMNSSL
jgi:hypothetical protein